ncbi:MAG: type I DNA topoisomerase [Lachnospiraceae bacterium]|nr:type I DNA topoisomerase [Lachnospiraceae bacterium]MDD7669278.1 type I DNA topoisomerase [Lachnospiraceae bacterium]MDY2620889.1 type I DNA topoisomerase [Agathobacter sp.]
MAKYLVIVESPAKVKTIKKFLGKNYEVMASNGHVRDLPKSQLGFSPENDFEPKYITIRGKGEILAKLRKEVKKADKIYLATDPDREGEAISWHLTKALKLDDKDVSRISFNEITKSAVKTSLKNPREIDMDLVDAQQARRMLDRMVGYRISPLLWAKVKRGLSAGRVQSVALRIVCDREEEINAFIPEEYWSLEASLLPEGEKKPIIAKLMDKNGEKIEITSKEQMDAVLAELKDKDFNVTDIKKGERTKKAPLPFTTSTLQQEASKALNFPISKTMRIAQQLYEGVDIKGQGTVGIITYLRTDSVRISEEADAAARTFVEETYGDSYVSAGETGKKSNAKIQDAHEAIRPTDINRIPSEIKESLSRDQFRLYQLIWKRFAASRMANAVYETTTVNIGVGDYRFRVSTSKVAFDGFMAVYTEADDEKAEKQVLLKSLDKDTKLSLVDYDPKQHFTQPPAHYTEASLVKTLEELGIGRPSTYSPTITTIIARRYITKENKNLYVTEIGEVVNSIMKESFPTIVDEHFTANMESLLDGVAEGKIPWKTVVANFYPDLEKAVQAAEEELEKITIEDEVTDEICEVCGRNMVIKYGPYGKFLACPGFPECRNTKPYYEKIGVACPKCGKDVVIKMTKKGRRYYGCIDYPECDFMSWGRPVDKKCPRCGGYMVEKGNKLACADEHCGYTEQKEKEK